MKTDEERRIRHVRIIESIMMFLLVTMLMVLLVITL
jgi:hypothetical protein